MLPELIAHRDPRIPHPYLFHSTVLDCRVQVDGEEKYQEAASVASRHCLCPDADACRVCTQKELRVASDLSSMPAFPQAFLIVLPCHPCLVMPFDVAKVPGSTYLAAYLCLAFVTITYIYIYVSLHPLCVYTHIQYKALYILDYNLLNGPLHKGEQGTKEMSQAADVRREVRTGTQSPVLGRAAAGFLALLLG